MEAQYTYDVDNLRIRKVVDLDGAGGGAAETTQFVHDGGHVVLEFDGSGSVTHRYLYGPAVDQVLSDERAGDLVWSLADHQGSVRDIIDASGNPIDTVTYTAFGEVIGDAPDFLFGYTGAVFDIETGLGYHRARYLDHATGRWISEDPIGFAAGDGPNLYAYVRNNPTNFVDPFGLTVFDATRSAYQSYLLLFRNPMHTGDSVINTEAGTINVASEALDYASYPANPNPGDKTYRQVQCVLAKLSLPLPRSRDGVYWAELSSEFLGYTVDWRGIGNVRISYSFVSTRYRGASITSQLFEDLLVTMYHEVKGHNDDGAQHRTPEEEIAFDAAYEAVVNAAIAAAKANGTWNTIVNCDCVDPPSGE